MTHVPCKSGAEVARDIVGGVLQLGWVDTTTGGQTGRAGTLRLLGVSGTCRVPGTPEVSTLAEQGYGLDQNGWLGLFAVTGTPEPVLRAVNDQVNKLMVGEEALRPAGLAQDRRRQRHQDRLSARVGRRPSRRRDVARGKTASGPAGRGTSP